MLLIIGVSLSINSLWTNQSVLGSSTDYSNNSLLSETNDLRLKARESILTIDPQLSATAQAKANDMVQRNY